MMIKVIKIRKDNNVITHLLATIDSLRFLNLKLILRRAIQEDIIVSVLFRNS